MPHAPSFHICIEEIAASLRHVAELPASVFTAFPVISGLADYYGSCVAMPADCGFRQSPVARVKY